MEDDGESGEEDFCVKGEGDMLGVVFFEAETLSEREVVSAGNLPVTGDAGFNRDNNVMYGAHGGFFGN